MGWTFSFASPFSLGVAFFSVHDVLSCGRLFSFDIESGGSACPAEGLVGGTAFWRGDVGRGKWDTNSFSGLEQMDSSSFDDVTVVGRRGTSRVLAAYA